MASQDSGGGRASTVPQQLCDCCFRIPLFMLPMYILYIIPRASIVLKHSWDAIYEQNLWLLHLQIYEIKLLARAIRALITQFTSMKGGGWYGVLWNVFGEEIWIPHGCWYCRRDEIILVLHDSFVLSLNWKVMGVLTVWVQMESWLCTEVEMECWFCVDVLNFGVNPLLSRLILTLGMKWC